MPRVYEVHKYTKNYGIAKSYYEVTGGDLRLSDVSKMLRTKARIQVEAGNPNIVYDVRTGNAIGNFRLHRVNNPSGNDLHNWSRVSWTWYLKGVKTYYKLGDIGYIKAIDLLNLAAYHNWQLDSMKQGWVDARANLVDRNGIEK